MHRAALHRALINATLRVLCRFFALARPGNHLFLARRRAQWLLFFLFGNFLSGFRRKFFYGKYLKRGLFEIRHADCDQLFFPAELILLVDHTSNVVNIVQRDLNVLSNLLVFDFHQRFSHLKYFTNQPAAKLTCRFWNKLYNSMIPLVRSSTELKYFTSIDKFLSLISKYFCSLSSTFK